MYHIPDQTTDWVRPIAAFYLAGPVVQLTGNVAAGSDDSGFVVLPPKCGNESVYANNEAHGVMVRRLR